MIKYNGRVYWPEQEHVGVRFTYSGMKCYQHGIDFPQYFGDFSKCKCIINAPNNEVSDWESHDYIHRR